MIGTGLNVHHMDISSNRSSICGAHFVYVDPLVDDALWVDAGARHPHDRYGRRQSHRATGYAGRVRGCGTFVSPRYSTTRIRIRYLHPAGGGLFWTADLMSRSRLIVFATVRVWEGRIVSERKADSVVWDRRPLYVVAQLNSGIHGLSNCTSSEDTQRPVRATLGTREPAIRRIFQKFNAHPGCPVRSQ